MDINNELKTARRNLLSIEGFELFEDFIWDYTRNKWVLKFSIQCQYEPTEYVPEITEWYCLISPLYPWGKIDIYPALDNSIKVTFQHQSYNRIKENCKWRTGTICVITSIGIWGKQYFNAEPFDTSRLPWHIERLKSWLNAAATNMLVVSNDPYELPYMPSYGDPLFVFKEDESTFQKWQSANINYGFITSKSISNDTPLNAIIKFESKGFNLNYNWGKFVEDSKKTEQSDLFILLDSIPIMKPWEIPSKWKDFIELCLKQNIDIKKLLLKYLIKTTHIIVGFPIPKVINGNNTRIHWFAIKLPKIPKVNGFRVNSETHISHLFSIMFKKDSVINWVKTENWNKEEITSRGRLDSSVSKLRFAIIGAGAIGSYVSEMILRLGCDNITIIDDDILAAGNMSRHTLTIDKVGIPKAYSLAQRLNSIFPSAIVMPINQSFSDTLNETNRKEILENTDVFIDATANESLISYIAQLLKGTKKKFISLSTSYKANRLYCFMKDTETGVIDEEFRDYIDTWLETDALENPNPDFPREGIGCWHPVMPARLDDILMLLSASIQRIERFLKDDEKLATTVFEKEVDDKNNLKGIKIYES